MASGCSQSLLIVHEVRVRPEEVSLPYISVTLVLPRNAVIARNVMHTAPYKGTNVVP